MTLSAISHYRGGTVDEVTPLARTLKAIYLKYGVGYRLSRFQTGANEGDWLAVVTYADATACEKVQALFSQDHRDCKVRQEDQPRNGARSRCLKRPGSLRRRAGIAGSSPAACTHLLA